MTKAILLVLAAVALSGCMVTDREGTYYTRAEIDAMAARSACAFTPTPALTSTSR